MVYLFHFERPVTEATWTCFATVYRPYLKCLTLSEVDASASCVMHLSRAYDDTTAGGNGVVQDHRVGDAEDGGEMNGTTVVVERHGETPCSAVTFLSFYYINTKKGKRRRMYPVGAFCAG